MTQKIVPKVAWVVNISINYSPVILKNVLKAGKEMYVFYCALEKKFNEREGKAWAEIQMRISEQFLELKRDFTVASRNFGFIFSLTRLHKIYKPYAHVQKVPIQFNMPRKKISHDKVLLIQQKSFLVEYRWYSCPPPPHTIIPWRGVQC